MSGESSITPGSLGISTVLEEHPEPKKKKYTVEQIQKLMPPGFKGKVSEECCELLNHMHDDPGVAKEMRDRAITYSSILGSGKYKLRDYLNAVRAVTLKCIGYTDKEAYIKTFPDRYLALQQKGASEKDISAYISAFWHGRMVIDLLTQVQIPISILNQDKKQLAINVLADIAANGRSERSRVNAADALLTHLEQCESGKVPGLQINQTLNINGDPVNRLMEGLAVLVNQSKNAINSGVPLSKVINAQIIDITPEENMGDEDVSS